MLKNKRILIINLLLILTTLIAFQQVGNHGFLSVDDSTYITENIHIQNGITIQGICWAFTTGHASNWHPLTWISHMLDIQFFGLNPQWHHLTNLLFHIANVLLLFFLLQRMTKALWQSAFVAALFALHPLHVESVAWVAERKDVLSTFFWMLTLVAYGYYAKMPRLKSYLAVMVFFAMGLMAKPMVVTLPFVLLLLDYWPLERFGKSEPARAIRTEVKTPVSERKRKGKTGKQTLKITVETEKLPNHEFQWVLIRPLVLEKIPLFALAIFSCAATYIAQNKGGAVAPIEIITPGIRIANAFVSYFIYITKMIWPDNLAVYYPHPGLLPLWLVLGSALFLVAVTFAVIRTAKRFPYLTVGWLWFAGTLVPVIGIVQVGGQALADRYTYIPSIGLFVMAAWGIPEIFRKRRYEKEILAASAALCLLILFILTSIQVGYWRDSITLFDHALNVTKSNAPMHNNRGNALHSLGNNARAIEDFDRAVEINPLFAEAYNGRGLARKSMGNYMRAIEDFDRAIEINPLYAGAYNSRGLVYNSMGNYSRAIEDFDRAIRIDSELAQAYNNRGNARDFLGDHALAIEDFERAIQINPEYADAYNNRGIAYDSLGNRIHAIEDFDRAIAINPGYTIAYYNRGSVHASLGNENQALGDMKTAAKFGSEDAKNYLKNKGIDW
jgi:protein O-mannosyl-transferase